MSTDTDAYLAYGYDLGDPEGDWKVTGLDWWNLDATDEYGDDLDFRDAVRARLPEDLGVEAFRHCSDEVPKYILSAHTTRAARGYPQPLDPAALLAAQEDADRRLAHALDLLEFTPTQERPVWLLASDWG